MSRRIPNVAASLRSSSCAMLRMFDCITPFTIRHALPLSRITKSRPHYAALRQHGHSHRRRRVGANVLFPCPTWYRSGVGYRLSWSSCIYDRSGVVPGMGNPFAVTPVLVGSSLLPSSLSFHSAGIRVPLDSQQPTSATAHQSIAIPPLQSIGRFCHRSGRYTRINYSLYGDSCNAAISSNASGGSGGTRQVVIAAADAARQRDRVRRRHGALRGGDGSLLWCSPSLVTSCVTMGIRCGLCRLYDLT